MGIYITIYIMVFLLKQKSMVDRAILVMMETPTRFNTTPLLDVLPVRWAYDVHSRSDYDITALSPSSGSDRNTYFRGGFRLSFSLIPTWIKRVNTAVQ